MNERTDDAEQRSSADYRRLPQDVMPGPIPGMFDLNDHDEERARSLDLGRISHAIIASLAAETRQPSLQRLKEAIDRALDHFAPIEARAHRQNLAGIIAQYFRFCLPPERFTLSGAERDLGTGRVDLVWFDFDDNVLIDEIKTGSPRSLRLTRTTEQVDRYLDAGRRAWGLRFVGVRLVCPSDRAQSLFAMPDGTRLPLSRSGFGRL